MGWNSVVFVGAAVIVETAFGLGLALPIRRDTVAADGWSESAGDLGCNGMGGLLGQIGSALLGAGVGRRYETGPGAHDGWRGSGGTRLPVAGEVDRRVLNDRFGLAGARSRVERGRLASTAKAGRPAWMRRKPRDG